MSTVATVTDPTAVNWQGDLTALPLELLNARTRAVALTIANAVADGHELRADLVQAYREAATEGNRRVETGDWNHEGRGEWA